MLLPAALRIYLVRRFSFRCLRLPLNLTAIATFFLPNDTKTVKYWSQTPLVLAQRKPPFPPTNPMHHQLTSITFNFCAGHPLSKTTPTRWISLWMLPRPKLNWSTVSMISWSWAGNRCLFCEHHLVGSIILPFGSFGRKWLFAFIFIGLTTGKKKPHSLQVILMRRHNFPMTKIFYISSRKKKEEPTTN